MLTLTKDRMTISKFQGTVGGGTLTAQGGVAFQPSIQFDLGMAAQNVRILYPQGMRESIDANLRLTGSRENATLGGSVNLSNLSFTPAFDLPTFINQFSGEVSSPPTRGFSQNVALNVALKSTNNVNLTSRTLSINGQANLQVRGTAADPVILGRVNLNRRGHHPEWQQVRSKWRHSAIRQSIGDTAGGEPGSDHFDSAIQHQPAVQWARRSNAHAI